MAQLVWTQPALEDLERIAEYIALDKPLAAKHFVEKVFNSVEKLHRFPKMGSHLQELRHSIYRQLIISPCRIFYRENENNVFVLHVMRSEQLLKEDFLNRE